MSDNKTSARALLCLSHPVSVGAILVLLINDHLLRHLWPSWWTGKIGDIAWLIFAPLVVALVVSLVLPHRKQAVIALAVASVAIVFAVGKTIPAVAEVITQSLTFVFHQPFQLIADSTDLIALPAELAAWFVWKTERQAGSKSRSSSRWLWPVAAAFATIANMGMAHNGVICLTRQGDGVIAAQADFETYTSMDGGLNWQASGPESPGSRPDCGLEEEIQTPQGLYRFTQQNIQLSVNNGQTWVQEIAFRGEEPRYAYYDRFRPEGYGARPGVFDALYDEASGNLVVAMGQDGILARTPDGTWHWITVGPYYRETFDHLGPILLLLSVEIAIGLAIAVLLSYSGLILKTSRRRWIFITILLAMCATQTVLLYLFYNGGNLLGGVLDFGILVVPVLMPVLGGVVVLRSIHEHRSVAVRILVILSLLLTTLLAAPAITWASTDYFAGILYGIATVAGVIGITLLPGWVSTLRGLSSRRLLGQIAVVAAIWAVFVLPFVGWAKGLIASYHISLAIGWLFALGILGLSWIVIRPGKVEPLDTGGSVQ